MLFWDEEAPLIASLPPSSSRSDPLMAARFPEPSATGTPRTALGRTRRFNAVNKRIINSKTDVNQLTLENPQPMALLFSQTFDAKSGGKALWPPIHGAGSQPNTMGHLTPTDSREVLFVN